MAPDHIHDGAVKAGGWERGARLAVDVGKVRVGVAVCDPDGILATPVATIPRDNGKPENDDAYVAADMLRISQLVGDHAAIEVIVGLPVTLAGKDGPAAAHVRAYAQVLAKVLAPVPVLLHDERMSTVAATRRLSESGVKARQQRAIIDQAAAVEILQHWLEKRRRRR